MSLDVYFEKKKWVSYDEGKTLEREDEDIVSFNITHNLGEMASEVKIGNFSLYEALWRPYHFLPDWVETEDYNEERKFEDENEVTTMFLREYLEEGLKELRLHPEKYKKFNPENGWGSYESLVRFTESCLNACIEHPDCIIVCSR